MSSKSAKPLSRIAAAVALTSGLIGAGAATAGEPGGFEVVRASVKPKQSFFAGKDPATLRYVFHSSGEPREVTVRVLNSKTRNVVARWTREQAQPGKRYVRSWNGATQRGGSAPDGKYAFRISSPGRPGYSGGRFRLFNFKFPIEGRHGTRGAIGEYGAPRSGGRTHEGFDVTAPCGTPLEAVRAGEVVRRGYDPRLYGNFVQVNARDSGLSYFYAHLRKPARVAKGREVRTGQVLGEVGLTGNAAGTPCHLHVEIRASGRLVDPKPYLTKWDRYS